LEDVCKHSVGVSNGIGIAKWINCVHNSFAGSERIPLEHCKTKKQRYQPQVQRESRKAWSDYQNSKREKHKQQLKFAGGHPPNYYAADLKLK
jgi:hypothetical protein